MNSIEKSISKILADFSNQSMKYSLLNIFGIQTAEKIHSNYLADLLNPKGKHKMNDIFLKLFLKEIEYPNWEKSFSVDYNSYKKWNLGTPKITEYDIGKITDVNKGGKIDIYLKNNVGKSIIIENKINAIEQHNQLLRYSNFDKDAYIVYLTLDAKESTSDFSNKNYKCISYKEHIIDWLNQCLLRTNKRTHNELFLGMLQYKGMIERMTFHNSTKQLIYQKWTEWKEKTDKAFPRVLMNPDYISFKIYCLVKDEYNLLSEDDKEEYGKWTEISNRVWNEHTRATIKQKSK